MEYIFSFRGLTDDPRLLKYETMLHSLYQNVLPLLPQPITSASDVSIKIQQLSTKYNRVRDLLPSDMSDVKKDIVCGLFFKQHQPVPTLPSWPPVGYPDVPYNEEQTAPVPPLCKVPGRHTETVLHASLRPIRAMIDESVNPAFNRLTLRQAYEYLVGIDIPDTVEHDVDKSEYIIKQALGHDDIDVNALFERWNDAGRLIDTTFLLDVNRPDRFYRSLRPTWMEYLESMVYRNTYTEIDFGFFNAINAFNSQLLKNRNQQLFLALPNTVDIASREIMLADGTQRPLNEFAWIKFSISTPFLKAPTEPEPGVINNVLHFQGYRLMDMPPPPILKALAHGPPEMSAHVATLFPEWTRADTLRAWLESTMVKWRSDISALAEKLSVSVCTSDNRRMRYLRDVPAIQLDLFNEALAYILSAGVIQRGTGRSIKFHVKNKEMRRTRKHQRGGASMPLAYYQDGAQMRGTYGEPTGVGYGAATNTMVRSAIQQTGGRRYARNQDGGFVPSIMGPVVQNGMYLMPVASFMGYKMMKKGKRSKSSRYSHRAPRVTHKKRRMSHKRS